MKWNGILLTFETNPRDVKTRKKNWWSSKTHLGVHEYFVSFHSQWPDLPGTGAPNDISHWLLPIIPIKKSPVVDS
jgi:hypothetical protein